MKSFVVMTYYQLMHSVAMALTLDEKPILYFSKSYLNVQEDLLDRIRETGVFRDVIGITGRKDLVKFIAELNKTEDYSPEEVEKIGNSIFEKYLEPYYAELFKDADFEDTIYVYNDFQWHFYYINKHFEHIVGIEDGYASLKQQLKVHRLRGDHKLVEKFLDKYYPEPLFRSPKIHEIISSKYFDDIPDDYKAKLRVLDFHDLVELHFEQYKDALLYIFNIADYEIEDGSVLFLSQPLSRALYCDPLQEYLMKKKILRNEVSSGREVYFKAHPADRIDPLAFKDEGVHVLPGSFPVELLNYKGCSFDKVLSFGSTGVQTMECADSFEVLYPNQNATKDEINSFIQELIKGETAILKVIFLVDELTTEAFINVYSGLYPIGKSIRTEVTVMVPAEIKKDAESYFDKENLKSKVSEYEKQHSRNGVCIWSSELRKIEEAGERAHAPHILACDNLNDEACVVDALKKDDQSYDFILIVHEKKPLFSLLKNVGKEFNKKFVACMAFQAYSEVPEKKMRFSLFPTAPGYVDKKMTGSLINKVWHHSLFNDLIPQSEAERVTTINRNYSSFARKFSDDLYIPYETYLRITDGFDYYLDKANKIAGDPDSETGTKVLLLANVVILYLDWLKITSNGYASFDEFVEQIETSEAIKRKVLGAVCRTLYYEKNQTYEKSASESFLEGQFLLKEIGISETAIKGAKKARKIKSLRNKLKK